MSNTAFVVATVILGLLLPFVSEFLNGLFKTSGPKALVVAGVLAVVAAVIALVATGGIKLTDLTLDNFTPVFTAIFTLSQLVFQFLKDKLGWTAPAPQ